MADDVANNKQRAFDSKTDALNPIGKTLRTIVEAVGSESRNPLLRSASALLKTEKRFRSLREIESAIRKGNVDDLIIRGFLFSSELMGVETEPVEQAMAERGGGPRVKDQLPPRRDTMVSRSFDP